MMKIVYPQDESKWLKSIRMLVSNYQITSSIDETDYPLQRENNQYLMKAAGAAEFSAYELLSIIADFTLT